MTDNTSTMAVGKLAAKLKARRVLASDEDGHTMTYSSGDPELVKAAALLDALAKERDALVADNAKLIAAAGEEATRAMQAERERYKARRMLAEADALIWRYVDNSDVRRSDVPAIEASTERHAANRASEAKETKSG